MRLKDTLRTLMGIRTPRAVSASGPKPQIGSNIVNDRLRIRLKYPVSEEQWEWFTRKGWRAIDMRGNRRRYTCVPDKFLNKLLTVSESERDELHHQLIMVVKNKRSTLQ